MKYFPWHPGCLYLYLCLIATVSSMSLWAFLANTRGIHLWNHCWNVHMGGVLLYSSGNKITTYHYYAGSVGSNVMLRKRLGTVLALIACNLGMFQDVAQAVWMGFLSDTKNCMLGMHRECWERYPRHWLQRKPLVSIPAVGDARAVLSVGITNPWWRENVPGIPGTCATHIFTYMQEAHATA